MSNRDRHRIRREYLLSQGICPVCRIGEIETGRKCCAKCRIREQVRCRSYRARVNGTPEPAEPVFVPALSPIDGLMAAIDQADTTLRLAV